MPSNKWTKFINKTYVKTHRWIGLRITDSIEASEEWKESMFTTLHYSLIDQKKKNPSYHRHLETLARFPFHLEISPFDGECCLPSTYIYSPFIVIDTLINQESDGPTSNHHFLRVASGGAGVCARVLLCRSARELLVGRSDVSFWFLFRIKSRQFNSPRPRRRTF